MGAPGTYNIKDPLPLKGNLSKTRTELLLSVCFLPELALFYHLSQIAPVPKDYQGDPAH